MTASMSVNSFRGRAFDFTIAGPARAAREYGSQFLITSASVFMNAGFAQAHNILDPRFAWAQAIGFEWTYLRGLANAGKTKSRWVDALNILAFVSVLLYGLMFCLIQYKVIPDSPEGLLAVLLAFIHVAPIAMTGFCAAMIHRAVKVEEHDKFTKEVDGAQARADRLQAERDALQLERERKEQDLVLYQRQLEIKRDMKVKPTVAAAERPPCPSCGVILSSMDFALFKSAEKRNAKFNGCKACRAQKA